MGLSNSFYISILRIKIYKVSFSMYITLMHSNLGFFLLQYDTRGQNNYGDMYIYSIESPNLFPISIPFLPPIFSPAL